MRVLFVSGLGEAMALALRVQEEGAEVRWYVHSVEEKDTGRGLLQRVSDWRAHLPWADLVVFDDVWMHLKHKPTPYGGGKWAEEVRRKGIPCVGGSAATDALENDRKAGEAMFKALGLEVAPMYRFHGPSAFDQAEQFVSKKGGGWALKHNNQVDKNLATVQWTPDEMISYLRWLKSVWPQYAKGLQPDFVLQEAIRGIEISTTAVFDGSRWQGVMVCQEYKRMLPGDLGPMTGAMGEVGTIQSDCKLWHKGLEKAADWLHRQKYHWVIDLSYIATEDRIVPLEFTCRFGYGTLWNLVNLLDTSLLDFLWVMATGEGKLRWKPGWSCYVTVASGMFPNIDPMRNKHVALLGDWRDPNVWPCGVMVPGAMWNARPGKPYRGPLESADPLAYLACVTGYGETIQEAREVCYKNADKIKVLPYRVMRNDIGIRFARDWAKLQEWGWVK